MAAGGKKSRAVAGTKGRSGQPTAARSAPSIQPPADPVQTVAFVSLGCPKNLVDSEKMLGLLAEDGLVPISDENQADAIVVNTCGFLEDSKTESIEVIRAAAEMKKTGKLKRLVVAGCLVQRHRAKMLEWCPDIDALIGVFDRDRVTQAVTGGTAPTGSDISADNPVYASIAASDAIARQRRNIETNGYHESDAARLRLTPRHYAYLRISEGCNQNCAFCTIPSIRGKMRSKPVDRIITEAHELIADGAFELNLIGQDTTSFGDDIAYTPGLSGMLKELDSLAAGEGGGWLRLMYAYPSCFTDAMIDTIAQLPNVLKYIDMPLQHINDRVLDSMRRKTSRSLIETLLQKLRDRIPGMTIRTTFITGYPGETEAEHNELLEFINDFQFENLGIFRYSPEPGTPAGTLHADGNAIDAETIERRYDEIMTAQQQIVFDRNEQLASQQTEFDVIIDGEAEFDEDETDATDASDDSGWYVGRTYQQAPEIDTVTVVKSNAPLTPGELVRCRIVATDGYDLAARPAAELERNVKLPVIT